jgi:DNA-directed RNA polymerase subunit alpha
MLQIHCLESKNEQSNSIFARFSVGPLPKSQGVTVGNAIRRTLLSGLEGLAIVGVRIGGVNHEFSTIEGIKEDVLEILLNLKQIVLKGEVSEPVLARLNVQGPGMVTAADIDLPTELTLVDSRQYIATIPSNKNLEMEFLLDKGKGYCLSNKVINQLPESFLAVDAVFMPVQKVNFFIETSQSDTVSDLESLILEIYTDGSITPLDAVSEAAESLQHLFGSLNLYSSPTRSTITLEEEQQDEKHQGFENILIEELELSVRAYNCLKRANIHTLTDLLQYSQEDLLEFKNFGQKSADEVCDSLELHFNKSLRK